MALQWNRVPAVITLEHVLYASALADSLEPRRLAIRAVHVPVVAAGRAQHVARRARVPMERRQRFDGSEPVPSRCILFHSSTSTFGSSRGRITSGSVGHDSHAFATFDGAAGSM